MNNKEELRGGLLTAELSALYQISSISFSDSEEKLIEEAMEKATRLFGVRYFALFTGPKDNRKLVASWGFRNRGDIWKKMKQNEPNQFHFDFGEDGEYGALFMEKAHPMENKERRLYTIFARHLENALLTARSISERKKAEEEVRKEKRFSENIVATVPDSLLVLDKDLRVKSANRSFYKKFQTEPEEVIGSSITDILGDEDGRLSTELIKLFGTEDMLEDFELHYQSEKLGERVFHITARGIIVAEEEEEEEEELVVIEDITERKRVEEAIIRAKQEWESTFDTIEEMILLTDAEGRIRRINRTMARKIGVKPKELIGKRCEEVLSCGCADTERCPLWRLRMNKAIAPCELELKSLGIWTRSMAYASHTPTGELDFVVLIYRDITEEKQREEALRKTEEHLRIIMEGANDGINYIDKEGVIIFANQQMKEILADPYPEGKPISAFYDEENQKILTRHLKQRWKGKGTVYEIELTDLKGQKHYLRVSGTPYRDKDGVIQGAFGIYQDITREKETEKALSEYKEALNRSFFGTAEALSKIIEDRDPYTSGHSTGVARLATAIARMMGYSEREIAGIYISGILHDIGKVAVPVEILVKPGMLTELEMSIIRTHSKAGYDILKEIDFPWPVAQITLQHHERMDGSGYPRGLKGEEIILGARILAVADVVDAMTHHRPYRPALSLEEAKEELRKGRGRLYDPQVVDVCLEVLERGQHDEIFGGRS